ncbi:hypothetical protein KGA66_00100 [Actinocrinis puniceicyclus]|uniref:Uncharacterized protein n=1 Tax=Actinocrinis puniceicyclus TaxID=977794 RepID=A0A8J7WKD3_9ACTN|nr:hypothetical protein [Actinocrinis puniceicyclus]MBS2961424.1 hypothetical protein [Actinocrinis puniceicyclus]
MSHDTSRATRVYGQAGETGREIHNVAQRAHGAQGHEKKLADSANVLGGETWENSVGHSGTRAGYIASGIVVAGFILGGVGLTVGPRVLIWIAVGIVVLTGIIGMLTHVWSDYRYEMPAPDDDESGSMTDDAHT